MRIAQLCFAILLPLATGWSQTSSPANASIYAVLAKAPKKAVSRHNPFENDRDAIPAGAKLFDMHCAECHGEMAEGGKKAPSLLSHEVQQATPGTLFWVLTNGVVRSGMPVWSKLPEPQRWQLVSYIKSLRPPPETASPSSSNERSSISSLPEIPGR
jgi:mono/diheme cytochrome c family protein